MLRQIRKCANITGFRTAQLYKFNTDPLMTLHCHFTRGASVLELFNLFRHQCLYNPCFVNTTMPIILNYPVNSFIVGIYDRLEIDPRQWLLYTIKEEKGTILKVYSRKFLTTFIMLFEFYHDGRFYCSQEKVCN